MYRRNSSLRLLAVSVSVFALAMLAPGLKAEETSPPVAQAVVETPATPPPEAAEAQRSEAPKTGTAEPTPPAADAPAQQAADPAPPAAEPVQQAQPASPAEPTPAPAPPQQSAEPAVPPAPPAPAAAAPTVTAAPEAPQPSPVATALRDIFAAIEAQPMPRDAQGRAVREDMKAIAAIYTARDFAPVWRDGDNWAPSAASAISRLQKAGEDALDPSAWKVPALSAADAPSIAAADVALSHSVVTYGRQASGGRVSPLSISRLITAKPETATASEILQKVAAAGGNAGDVLQGFNPPHPSYRALRANLLRCAAQSPSQRKHLSPLAPAPCCASA